MRSPDFLPRYIDRYKPALLGFLILFGSAPGITRIGKCFRLLNVQEEPRCFIASGLHSRIDGCHLALENVKSSRNGVILCASRMGMYTRRPWDSPENLTLVGPNIPPLKHCGINILGRFGFIPHAGSFGMAFFQLESTTYQLCDSGRGETFQHSR